MMMPVCSKSLKRRTLGTCYLHVPILRDESVKVSAKADLSEQLRSFVWAVGGSVSIQLLFTWFHFHSDIFSQVLLPNQERVARVL